VNFGEDISIILLTLIKAGHAGRISGNGD